MSMLCINSGVWKMLWSKRTCSGSKALEKKMLYQCGPQQTACLTQQGQESTSRLESCTAVKGQ